MRILILGAALAVLSTASCSPADTRSGGTIMVRDSAGARIVDNGTVEGTSGGWSVDPEPVFRVGWDQGGPTFVRLRGGTLLPGGGAAVIDHEAAQVYRLSPTGVVVQVLGREGEGPGEFRSPQSVVGLPGDSILVHDPGNQRVSLFVRGDLVDEFRVIRQGAVAHRLAGPLAGGDWLLVPGSLALALNMPEGWQDSPLIRTGPRFESVDTIVTVGYVDLGDPTRPTPFRHFGTAVASVGVVAYARSDLAEVVWIDSAGDTVQVARWTARPRIVDADFWREYEVRSRERMGPESGAAEQRFIQQLAEMRQTTEGPLPLFGRIWADDEGNVWLSEYPLSGTMASRYHVVARDGRWLGPVDFPRPVDLVDLRGGLALVFETNEWDVQAAAVYRFRRGA